MLSQFIKKGEKMAKNKSIVEEVKEDYERRREARKSLDKLISNLEA